MSHAAKTKVMWPLWGTALLMLTGGSMPLELKSSAFATNGSIPRKFTCQGSDVSPPLAWSGVPAGTRSLALVVSDPDAPDPKAPRTIWSHWVVFNIPPSVGSIAEGAAAKAIAPEAREGRNDFEKVSWGGPCPPVGRHRYFFRLYALDTTLDADAHPTRQQIEAAMKSHVLGTAELMGTYEKG